MAYNNLDFEAPGYIPEAPYDMDFYSGVTYYVLKGTSNFFSAVWVANGRLMAASPAALSIMDIDTNTVVDWYTQTFGGRGEEVLDSSDIKDVVGD